MPKAPSQHLQVFSVPGYSAPLGFGRFAIGLESDGNFFLHTILTPGDCGKSCRQPAPSGQRRIPIDKWPEPKRPAEPDRSDGPVQSRAMSFLGKKKNHTGTKYGAEPAKAPHGKRSRGWPKAGAKALGSRALSRGSLDDLAECERSMERPRRRLHRCVPEGQPTASAGCRQP